MASEQEQVSLLSKKLAIVKNITIHLDCIANEMRELKSLEKTLEETQLLLQMYQNQADGLRIFKELVKAM